MRRTASRRLIWPSIWLAQVGVFASSKSAMNTLAPEFSALMTILRSTGPVISTRRSWMSGRHRRHRPVAGAHLGGLGEEIGLLAAVEARLDLLPLRQQLLDPRAELALQLDDEVERRARQDRLVARPQRRVDQHARRQRQRDGACLCRRRLSLGGFDDPLRRLGRALRRCLARRLAGPRHGSCARRICRFCGQISCGRISCGQPSCASS